MRRRLLPATFPVLSSEELSRASTLPWSQPDSLRKLPKRPPLGPDGVQGFSCEIYGTQASTNRRKQKDTVGACTPSITDDAHTTEGHQRLQVCRITRPLGRPRS